jgi:hypothetical protein
MVKDIVFPRLRANASTPVSEPAVSDGRHDNARRDTLDPAGRLVLSPDEQLSPHPSVGSTIYRIAELASVLALK